MNLSLYLEKLYHTKPEIIKTNLGLTNDIYKVIINHESYALRVPKMDVKDFIGVHEEECLKLIKTTNLDVEEIFYDSSNRIRMTRWLDNCLEFKDYIKDDKYLKATKLIKKLHNYEFKVNHDFDIYEMYLKFKYNIKYQLFDYAKYEYLFLEFNNLNHKKVLCHNDLVSGNILFKDDEAYLIDYEYAAMNHPYFDIMSLISENNIDDEDIRKQIYQEYFGNKLNDEILKELQLIENMQNLLWAAWANMLYDSRSEEIYLTIFKDKINHLLRGIE